MNQSKIVSIEKLREMKPKLDQKQIDQIIESINEELIRTAEIGLSTAAFNIKSISTNDFKNHIMPKLKDAGYEVTQINGIVFQISWYSE